jgi:arylsulfatase A-like enzyme
MKRLYVFCIFIVFLLVSCQQLDKKVEKERSNIILFLVDDLGWQDTSVPFWTDTTENNRKYSTPNMEKLAQQGMKFTQAYACAVCSPTRVSLLSGMNAARHRVTNWTLQRGKNSVSEPENLRMPDWNLNGVQSCDSIEQSVYVTPLPQILKNNGYFTIHCGKAHFGAISTPGENPKSLGFDINIAGHAAGGPGSYLGENNFSANWRGGGAIWDVPGLEKYHGEDINLTEALTREAKLAMDSAILLDKPFYLYMAHYGVHTPLEPDKRFYQKYKDMGYEEPEARYASMVESVDKSLGDLIKYLEAKDIAENTIVIFMSDNGGLSAVARGGEPHKHNLPLSSGKGSAHEGGIREPMIVKWLDKVTSGSSCDEYLIIEDFFPSILEMADITEYETVQHIDGVSFLPLLMQESNRSIPRALYWHYPNNWGPTGPGIGASSTIRLGDWKLIYYHMDESFELFNLAEDIGESNNLAAANKEKLSELARNLSDYLKSVDAQMPINKTTQKTVSWPVDAIQ